MNIRTEERELEGENDHLIYFVLQSESFTRQPRVEPALSAREFVESLKEGEWNRYLSDQAILPPVERLSQPALARFRDFAEVVERASPNSSRRSLPSGQKRRASRGDSTTEDLARRPRPDRDDERLAYFRAFIKKNKAGNQSVFEYLCAQYARSMRFLYQKEFVAQKTPRPENRAAAVASLYQSRGHSTDTQVEANFAVFVALGALKSELASAQLNNVLIVGPGLDFAPRTDFIDLFPPQSYQPFAVADALIGLKMADPGSLRIHCVDINDRVVSYLQNFPRRPVRRLLLLSGVRDDDQRPLSDDYREYFRALGKYIGDESSLEGLPEKYGRHLRKSLVVRKEVADSVSVDKLNIITQRYGGSPQYDLVVATNIFPYFSNAELLLSLSNIEAMLKPGGYLIHNEPRPNLLRFATLLSLSLVQTRTVLIAPAGDVPLYDAVWTHRKQPGRVR